MKILTFYQYFGTPKGKWSTRVYEMSLRWIEQGHEVTVLTSAFDKSDLKAKGIYSYYNIEGIDVYVINAELSNKHGFAYRIYTFLFYAFWAALLGLTLRKKFDLILTSSGPLTVGIPALITKWVRRIPMAYELRDLWLDAAVDFGIVKNKFLIKMAYWFEDLCFNNSKLVVASSEGVKVAVLERFPEKKVITIPNAADLELFRYSKIQENGVLKYKDQKLFVYTGTVGFIDKCLQIVEAAEELQKRGRHDIKVLIIGDGKERKELEATANSKNLSNIEFLGLMPKQDLIGYVRACRASLLTVKPVKIMDRCSPNKIFDAFAAGVPIIQNTQGWIKDMVEETNCGLNTPPYDPKEFANAIEKLADDDALFEEQCKNSARLGETEFNREHISNKMLKGLEELYLSKK